MDEIFKTNKSLLKSMLLDEEKLLTYVSISKELCLHVNTSKVILQSLIQHVRQENSDLQLNVCYIISGTTDNNNARTTVCLEQDLTKERECFKNILFEHIYSVRKGCPNIEPATYLTVNKFEDFALCCGLVKSKQCDKRTLNEIGNLKLNSQDTVVPEKTKSLPVSSKTNKQDTKLNKNANNEIKFLSRQDMENKSEPLIKQEIINSPKKEVTGSVSNNQPKASLSNGQKAQKGIAGFFNKTNGINKKEVKDKFPRSKTTKQEIEVTNIKCEKMDIEEVKEIESKEVIPVVEVEVEEKKKNTNKVLNQIKRTSRVDKKRKRVLHVSDSESDNENNDPFGDEVAQQDQNTHDSDDEIPPTPTVTNIVIKSGITNPRKRRKVVDKTYTDEDGYILTKKVEVYESCSENEEEVVTKTKDKVQEKPPPSKEVKNEISPKGKSNASKKKVSPPQKGKQPTLTNFFKKL